MNARKNIHCGSSNLILEFHVDEHNSIQANSRVEMLMLVETRGKGSTRLMLWSHLTIMLRFFDSSFFRINVSIVLSWILPR
jgi:hypothetical protein